MDKNPVFMEFYLFALQCRSYVESICLIDKFLKFNDLHFLLVILS